MVRTILILSEGENITPNFTQHSQTYGYSSNMLESLAQMTRDLQCFLKSQEDFYKKQSVQNSTNAPTQEQNKAGSRIERLIQIKEQMDKLLEEFNILQKLPTE